MAFLDRFLSEFRRQPRGKLSERVGKAWARAEADKPLREPTAAEKSRATFPGKKPVEKSKGWFRRFIDRITGEQEPPTAVLAETGLRGEGVPAPGPFRPWQWGTTLPPEEIKPIGEEELRDFVVNGELILWQSSNLYASQYFPTEQALMIETRAGRAYLIRDISPKEAIDFIKARSKGRWTWAHVRGPAQLRAPSTPGIPGLKPITRLK